MKKILPLFFILLFIFCSTQQEDVSIIYGKLVGYNGKPLKNVDIKFNFIGKVKPVSLNLEKDGSYQIKTKHIGYINIEFSGANHRSVDVPILLSKPQIIRLNIVLSSNEFNNDSNIQFMDTSSLSAKYHLINEWFKEYKNKNDMEKAGEEIFAKIASEKDIDTKSLLCYTYMMNFFNTPELDPDRAKEILQIIPPSSIVWTMSPNFLMWFSFILPKEDLGLLNGYIERVSNENKYQSVRAEAISYFLSLAEMEEDSIKIRKLYKRLITECPESFRARDARFKYEILAPGKEVPSFSVTSIDNPEEVYTEKSLLAELWQK